MVEPEVFEILLPPPKTTLPLAIVLPEFASFGLLNTAVGREPEPAALYFTSETIGALINSFDIKLL